MKEILIVGYGNTLRGDDGLGPLIAQHIADRPQPRHSGIRVACLPQLDISLVTEMKDAGTVIFIDARQDDNDRVVTVKRIEPAESPCWGGHSTHSMGIGTLLAITRNWYATQQHCYLVMPKGYDFSIRDTISAQGRQSADCAITKIDEILGTLKLNHGNRTRL